MTDDQLRQRRDGALAKAQAIWEKAYQADRRPTRRLPSDPAVPAAIFSRKEYLAWYAARREAHDIDRELARRAIRKP